MLSKRYVKKIVFRGSSRLNLLFYLALEDVGHLHLSYLDTKKLFVISTGVYICGEK